MTLDVEDALRIAEELLGSSVPRRWSHVKGVGYRAATAAKLFLADEARLLTVAAVLHDIGYSPYVAVSGFHPLDGAVWLKDGGHPERLCALVAHHSCAYREAELRGLSVELVRWTDEQTPLRDALWWADMTTTPDGEVTNVHDRIEEIQKRYGPDDLVTFFIRQARAELVAAVERTEMRLRVAGLGHLAK